MEEIKVRGLNHLTLAVTNRERSIAFYRDVLGCELRAVWARGAHLEAGALWLCLSVDDAAQGPERLDYTHYAFDIGADQFDVLAERIRRHAPIWKADASEGASLYFLDPDGHRLELHVGSLATRLGDYKARPDAGVTIIGA